VHSGANNGLDPLYHQFYFAGHLTVKAIFQYLVANNNLGAAHNALISGSSAGGIGTWVNADDLTALLPNAQVKGSPQGGWFFPNVTSYPDWQSGIFVQADWSGSVLFWGSFLPPGCVAAHPQNPNVCATLDVSYRYVKTPLFFIQNEFDSNQIFTQLECPNDGSKQENEFVSYFGTGMMKSVSQLTSSPSQNGIFLMSCLDHTSNTKITSKTLVQGHTVGPVLVDWYFNHNTLPHVLVDNCVSASGLPCNPGCAQWL